MQILINPTVVTLNEVESTSFVFTNRYLEARDTNGVLLAMLAIEITRDAILLSMKSFGRLYKLPIEQKDLNESYIEQAIEQLLNSVNLTLKSIPGDVNKSF